MQNEVKPGHLSFLSPFTPDPKKEKALRTDAVRWSRERVAVSDVAASSI